MKRLIQRIKRRFCRHEYRLTYLGNPSLGYQLTCKHCLKAKRIDYP